MKKAIVIGAGIAGIATSIRLAKKGYKVDVFEANSYPGGKLTSFMNGEYRFDAGPSLFTLPHLVTELFDLCGENPEDYFSYNQQDSICNYFWDDGTRYHMPAGKEKIVDSLVQKFGEDREVITEYLQNSKAKYQLTSPIFLEKSLHKLSTYWSIDTMIALMKSSSLGLSTTLNKTNEKTFSSEKVIQMFNRYATYNGSSPYKTPGIMSMIPHLEMDIGTFFPEGGMESITNSLVGLADRNGVVIHYNTKVQEVIHDNNRATAVRVNGKLVYSDVVISNMDVFSTYTHLLPKAKQPTKILNQERSSSALIFYWGIDGSHSELDLHNIFFSNRYKEEFQALFEDKNLIDDPTIYVNISSKCNPSDAPDNCENWFVMINAPGDYGQDWDSMIDNARENIIIKISKALGIDLKSKIVSENILDPRSIERKTQSHKGALYGTASNNKYAAFLRHPNFSKQLKNLYFVGGSVHPGGGIPLCLNSAKIVSNLI